MKQKKTSFSVGFLLLVSFFQFPVRLQAGAFITYILVYLLPLIYLIINVNWLISFLRIRAMKKPQRLHLLILSLFSNLPLLLFPSALTLHLKCVRFPRKR